MKHVWIEEPVPQADVTVHLPPSRRHPRQHRSDQRVPETERRRGELVEYGGVARGVVFAGVALLDGKRMALISLLCSNRDKMKYALISYRTF